MFVQKKTTLSFSTILVAESKLQSRDQNNTECKKLLSYIMSTAGDCRLMISHVTSTDDIDKYREQYQTTDAVDSEIHILIDDIGIDENSSGKLIQSFLFLLCLVFLEFSWVYELTPMIERNLSASVHAYEYAINIIQSLGENEKQRLNLLVKRLGNVRNEMGVYWMNQCAQALKNINDEVPKVR